MKIIEILSLETFHQSAIISTLAGTIPGLSTTRDMYQNWASSFAVVTSAKIVGCAAEQNGVPSHASAR
jgi:hypothetical protein